MRCISTILFVVTAVVVGFAQTAPSEAANSPRSVASILPRVAANQDRSEELRKQYMCREHIRVVTHKPGGRMVREETADYESVPTPTGSRTELKQITGRFWEKGKYKDFKGEPIPADDSWDADYIRDVRLCLTEQARCTVGAHLFPLTTAEQDKYDFHLIGQEVMAGRNAYHIGFVPKNKEMFDWAGEAFVDAGDFQPIRVFTKLSRRVPFFARNVVGTNLSGFGYELDYRRQDGGIWFPVMYGAEYELRLLFRIHRNISISMEISCHEPAGISAK